MVERVGVSGMRDFLNGPYTFKPNKNPSEAKLLFGPFIWPFYVLPMIIVVFLLGFFQQPYRFSK